MSKKPPSKTAAKPGKKAAKKTAKVEAKPRTIAQRSAKTAAAKDAAHRRDSFAVSTLYRLWATAAYVAAEELAAKGVDRWAEPEAEAARMLLLRMEGVTPKNERTSMRLNDKPVSFSTWKATAARILETAILAPHQARGDRRGKFTCSPYMLVIAAKPGHEFYDPRGQDPVDGALVTSVDQVGVLADISVHQLVEQGKPRLYIADGRQRENAVIAVNRIRVRRWLLNVPTQGTLGQLHGPSLSTPPELILEVPVHRVDAQKDAQRAGGVLNAKGLRRDDSFRDLAHRIPQLKKAGLNREEIAAQLGLSSGTVSNLLSLQKLAPQMAELLWSSSKDAIAPACAYVLATQDAEHQVELWGLASKLPPPRRTEFLKALVAAEARVAECEGACDYWKSQPELAENPAAARATADLAAARVALERIRTGAVERNAEPRPRKVVHELLAGVEHFGGEAGRLVKAAIDFVLGKGVHATVEELLAELAASPATEVTWRAVMCPDCCVDPGQACQDDDGPFDPETGYDMTEPHASRVEAARAANAGKSDRPSTVDGRREKKGQRRPKPGSEATTKAWEAADIWDERLAAELEDAGISPDDMKRTGTVEDGVFIARAHGHSLGEHFSIGALSLVQVQAVVRQLPLIGEDRP